MKYRVELVDDLWHVASRGGAYQTAYPTKREAEIIALQWEAQDAENAICAVLAKLEKMGAMDNRDPRGFLA